MKNIFKKICMIIAMTIGITGSYSIGAFASDDFEIGVFNFNSTSQNSARIGDVITIPEKGWKRYDDLNSKIVYDGKFSTYTYDIYLLYKGSYTHSFELPGQKIKFKFYGKNLRIITPVGTSCSGGNIKIDNVDYGNFNAYRNGTFIGNSILFEKLNLEETVHEVVITTLTKDSFSSNATNSWFGLDAIDVDGYLLPYYPLTLNKSLLNIQKGNFEKLIPSETENVDIIWNSSDENVAVVDQTGKVTGIGEGQATISAKIKGMEESTSCNVVVSDGNTGVTTNSAPNINNDIITCTGSGYIEMSDGNIKEAKKIDSNNFLTWYKNRCLDKNIDPFYKITNVKGNNEYLMFDKIVSFEIR